jgi:hypothetical protein
LLYWLNQLFSGLFKTSSTEYPSPQLSITSKFHTLSNRPANAFGTRINDVWILEKDYQHDENVLLLKEQYKENKLTQQGLDKAYVSGEITQQTHKKVTRFIQKEKQKYMLYGFLRDKQEPIYPQFVINNAVTINCREGETRRVDTDVWIDFKYTYMFEYPGTDEIPSRRELIARRGNTHTSMVNKNVTEFTNQMGGLSETSHQAINLRLKQVTNSHPPCGGELKLKNLDDIFSNFTEIIKKVGLSTCVGKNTTTINLYRSMLGEEAHRTVCSNPQGPVWVGLWVILASIPVIIGGSICCFTVCIRLNPKDTSSVDESMTGTIRRSEPDEIERQQRQCLAMVLCLFSPFVCVIAPCVLAQKFADYLEKNNTTNELGTDTENSGSIYAS